MTILNAVIDLVSFSEILYSIYPPLFVALVVYSIGGTGVTLFLGRKLVGLNFQQEAQEANFRCACKAISHNSMKKCKACWRTLRPVEGVPNSCISVPLPALIWPGLSW